MSLLSYYDQNDRNQVVLSVCVCGEKKTMDERTIRLNLCDLLHL